MNRNKQKTSFAHLDQELDLVLHLLGAHAGAPAEEYEGLADGELAVQRDLLGHVADSWSGYA